MRDPKRIQGIQELIEKLWEKDPDLRFMQLIYNIQSSISYSNDDLGKVVSEEQDGFERTGYDLFNLEDDILIQHLKNMVENNG
ncbi:hypothetical protein ACJJI5_10165 [Microbulbifer sp. EKSA008]|uniref:hypothetical protein n=1 Tax=Microbulbifer sp. EKSA008 TaxID=3243367 RepID=UPI004042B138